MCALFCLLTFSSLILISVVNPSGVLTERKSNVNHSLGHLVCCNIFALLKLWDHTSNDVICNEQELSKSFHIQINKIYHSGTIKIR